MPEADWWRSFHNQEFTQFIERALAQNHDVRREVVSRVLEGRAPVTTAGAGLYPQLNVQGSYTNLAISKNTLAGLGLATGQQPKPQIFATPGSSFDLWNGAADLRWELDVWGRIRRGLEAASAEAQAIEQEPAPLPDIDRRCRRRRHTFASANWMSKSKSPAAP